MSAHASGMCMSQCKHWRIPLFPFAVSRKAKGNASKSLLLRQRNSLISFRFQAVFFILSGFCGQLVISQILLCHGLPHILPQRADSTPIQGIEKPAILSVRIRNLLICKKNTV